MLKKLLMTAVGVCSIAASAHAVQFKTNDSAQMTGLEGWEMHPLVTIGEELPNGKDVNEQHLGYRLPGILDGIGAFSWGGRTLRTLINHELREGQGYPYELLNGTKLTGARVSYVDIDTITRKVTASGMAYDTIYDRAGTIVTDPAQIHEGIGSDIDGLHRLCSSYGLKAGKNGFVNNLYFSGEETSSGFGGQETVLDVDGQALYVVPMLGRAAFENVTTLNNFGTNKVVVLIGDDRGPAPLLVYIGEKGAAPAVGPYSPPDFLKANGLGMGNLYVWVSDNGDSDPSTFNGTGNSRSGKFKKINHFDPASAGVGMYDSLGFASLTLQDIEAASVGGFLFSRPEDVATNPADGTQVVLASTGRSSLFGGVDSWGITYVIDFDSADLSAKLADPLAVIDNIVANISILYDGDDAGAGQFAGPDYGLRSPDNLDWADNGMIYVQEDRSIGAFGTVSGAEASIWKIDPGNGLLSRIAEMDRLAIPFDQFDSDPDDIGDWESSGILDVTEFFKLKGDDHIFIINTQAHSLKGEPLGGASQNEDLVQGGQLLLMTLKK